MTLQAKKGNVVLDIPADDATFYQSKGYAIYDGASLVGKPTPVTVYDYRKELADREADIESLKAQIEFLEKKIHAQQNTISDLKSKVKKAEKQSNK